MNPEFTARIPPDVESLSRTIEEVAAFLAAVDVPEDASYAVQLAIEELVTNTFKYGFPNREARPVALRIVIHADHAGLELTDDGDPFNPFAQPAPDFNLPAEERPPGGLGLHFVSNMMDECQYTREPNRNILRLRKKFP
jgi:serine/threonine-protein kinase RsbW